MENTESTRARTAPNTSQAITALRKQVWQKSEEVDRLTSGMASVQSRLDLISRAYRRLLGSVMALAAIVLGISIGLLAALE